ncbi:EH signature domain-containing protein [Palleronia sp. KMU-117]|uniref:EH signature domain-containing protein n=1 Tax=Palleronia sp. KMU-117 TaxID=3434108 RepID=UPI003D73DC33
MRFSDARARSAILTSRAMPPLDAIQKSVARITARWPDVVAVPDARNREALAMEMLLRISKWAWKDVKLSRVMSAAVAVFDEERRDRPDLEDVRRFYLDEIRATDSSTFLQGMTKVYIETFDPSSPKSAALARQLKARADGLDGRTRDLLAQLPALFDPEDVPRELAEIMAASDDPYTSLKQLGFRTPHGTGLTRSAHRPFVAHLAPHLRRVEEREKLWAWIAPRSGSALQTDAAHAVEALLKPWAEQTPPDEVREEISEAIIAAYNDPRTHNGGIWSGFSPELRAVLLRWLTKQDMLFFCDMVTATQNSHMWPPRRDFWLSLYEDGRIDEAWVAFGASARDFARRKLLRSGVEGLSKRFGQQHDRGGSTSLLIMRIGDKIVVDGCHSYRTHIFRRDDPKAPKLYGMHYYCDDIMRVSRNAKSHSSIPAWQDWVLRHV